ncbi:tail fiber assembly protein [Erwinia rhapontici]|uniref:tail fiber assembly protein n=1 Tax=Erwinia rhapontici TaxID=55212 RepID=UPI0035B58E80
MHPPKQRYSYLKDEKNIFISRKLWSSKLALGSLKDAENEKFNAWIEYTDWLSSLDSVNAPDLIYPKRPGKNG